VAFIPFDVLGDEHALFLELRVMSSQYCVLVLQSLESVDTSGDVLESVVIVCTALFSLSLISFYGDWYNYR
jgi:hypothetical protein